MDHDPEPYKLSSNSSLFIENRFAYFGHGGLEHFDEPRWKSEHFSVWAHYYFVIESLTIISKYCGSIKLATKAYSLDLVITFFWFKSLINRLKTVTLSKSLDEDSMCLFTKDKSSK